MVVIDLSAPMYSLIRRSVSPFWSDETNMYNLRQIMDQYQIPLDTPQQLWDMVCQAGAWLESSNKPMKH